jgi:hypothetical protein
MKWLGGNNMEKRTTRSHYKIIDGKMLPKKGYDTEMDALTTARFLNSQPYSIHKMVAYKCIKCDKWHIGSTDRVLTEEDRREAAEKLKKYKHIVL